MKELTVAELKADFSDILMDVRSGQKVTVLYGRAKKPVAVLSPIEPSHKRKLGTYEGIATFSEVDGGKITEEEFLGR